MRFRTSPHAPLPLNCTVGALAPGATLIEKEPSVAPCMLITGLKWNPAFTTGHPGGLAAGPVAAARALATPESDAVGSVTSGLACGDPPRRRSVLLVPSSSLELSDKMSCLLLAASGALFCPTSWGSSSHTTPSMLLPQHTKSSPHTPKSSQSHHKSSPNCAVSTWGAGRREILPVAYFGPEGGHRAPVAYFFRHPRFL